MAQLSGFVLRIRRIAARLNSFKCDGCSLGLPPQSFFSSPEDNPRLIQQLLEGGASETALDLSAVGLTPAIASDAAAVLQLYPALNTLDLSGNARFLLGGFCLLVSSLAGLCLFRLHHFVFARL